MNRRRVLAAGATLTLAGCLSYPGSDADEPADEEFAAELVEDAIATRRGMTDLAARRTMSVETPDGTVERTEDVVRAPPAKQRIEVVESTDPNAPVGSVTVTNRERTWEYNPETGIVDLQHHPYKVDTDGTRLVLEALLETDRLGYDGTTTVDGREAHVVETRPPVDDIGRSLDLVVGDTTYVVPLSTADLEGLDVARTIWIDDEYRYPVGERNAVEDDGETRYSVSVTYENLSIDDGTDAETFTYQPPREARVVTDGPEPDGIFESRTEAADAVPYELPDPDVPNAYRLDRVTVVEKAERFGTTTTLWYNDPNAVARELFVVVREVRRFSSNVLEEIEVDGLTAYYRDGRIQSVFWECDDLNYEVSSLTADEPIRDIASSIGCP